MTERGFSLVELILVILLLGLPSSIAIPRLVHLSDEARKAVLQEQARNLVSNNSLSLAVCQVDSPDCIEFGVTGFSPDVCRESIRLLLPEAGDGFAATTFASSIAESQWQNLPGSMRRCSGLRARLKCSFDRMFPARFDSNLHDPMQAMKAPPTARRS